ncbi:putative uncharacterized protein DDB_G0277255 [Achroia grisella]|uniref:putative uncharacterized protein DDB_G0277255 n=1 Tax=Achroia grisella TaxID=688607 RepID=UPI0027D1EAEF|nr:putative uncharacterized protein DDB_G0277255 [Achroia grisella]
MAVAYNFILAICLFSQITISTTGIKLQLSNFTSEVKPLLPTPATTKTTNAVSQRPFIDNKFLSPLTNTPISPRSAIPFNNPSSISRNMLELSNPPTFGPPYREFGSSSSKTGFTSPSSTLFNPLQTSESVKAVPSSFQANPSKLDPSVFLNNFGNISPAQSHGLIPQASLQLSGPLGQTDSPLKQSALKDLNNINNNFSSFGKRPLIDPPQNINTVYQSPKLNFPLSSPVPDSLNDVKPFINNRPLNNIDSNIIANNPIHRPQIPYNNNKVKNPVITKDKNLQAQNIESNILSSKINNHVPSINNVPLLQNSINNQIRNVEKERLTLYNPSLNFKPSLEQANLLNNKLPSLTTNKNQNPLLTQLNSQKPEINLKPKMNIAPLGNVATPLYNNFKNNDLTNSFVNQNLNGCFNNLNNSLALQNPSFAIIPQLEDKHLPNIMSPNLSKSKFSETFKAASNIEDNVIKNKLINDNILPSKSIDGNSIQSPIFMNNFPNMNKDTILPHQQFAPVIADINSNIDRISVSPLKNFINSNTISPIENQSHLTLMNPFNNLQKNPINRAEIAIDKNNMPSNNEPNNIPNIISSSLTPIQSTVNILPNNYIPFNHNSENVVPIGNTDFFSTSNNLDLTHKTNSVIVESPRNVSPNPLIESHKSETDEITKISKLPKVNAPSYLSPSTPVLSYINVSPTNSLIPSSAIELATDVTKQILLSSLKANKPKGSILKSNKYYTPVQLKEKATPTLATTDSSLNTKSDISASSLSSTAESSEFGNITPKASQYSVSVSTLSESTEVIDSDVPYLSSLTANVVTEDLSPATIVPTYTCPRIIYSPSYLPTPNINVPFYPPLPTVIEAPIFKIGNRESMDYKKLLEIMVIDKILNDNESNDLRTAIIAMMCTA